MITMKYWDHKRELKESVKALRDIVNISVFDAQQTHLILEPDDQNLPSCWPIHFLDVSQGEKFKNEKKEEKNEIKIKIENSRIGRESMALLFM